MTADQLQLITAAVDGEQSAEEQRAFRLLLATSAEARVLFERFKADSARVRALHPVAPPADLQAKILAKLASATPRKSVPTTPSPEPKRAAQPSARRGVPAWAQFVLAASVFLSLASASFLYLTRNVGVPEVAKTKWADVLPVPHGTPNVPSPGPQRPDAPPVVRNDDTRPPAPAPHPRDVVPAPDAVVLAPEPRAVGPGDLTGALGFPLLPKLPPLERVEARLPFLRAVADLGRDDLRQELLAELNREPTAYKFDLFVRDTARGWEVFSNAAKASGLPVLADAVTLDKLKKKQAQAVMVYTESLTAAELAALFAKLSAEDTKFSPRVCDSLHAAPAVRSEELELKALLGADVGLFKRIGASGAGPVTSDKSVAAGTVDAVVKTVGKVEKSAILTLWQPAQRTHPAASNEVKTYLSKRGDRKPNAVPAIIVIRTVG